MTYNTDLAKKYFYDRQYDVALDLFTKEKNDYASGLCCLLLKKTKEAYYYWKRNKNNSLGCFWGLCVLNYIDLKYGELPSFFATRAFLEIYLSLFMENDLIEYAQNLISCCDELYKSNPETYKFIGRALFANGYFDLAITFCKKSLDIYYSDPEALIILSETYYLMGDKVEALKCINKALNMADDYYPAKLFKNILLNT